MYIKKFLNSLSKYLIITIASIVSVLCLIVLALFIYISTFEKFLYVDKLGYFSKVISWYSSKDIKIDSIKVEKNNNIKSYKISISNFEKYSNSYLEVRVPLLSFNCNIIDCLKDFGAATNMFVLEPEFNIKIVSNLDKNNNNIYEGYLQLLGNINSFIIKNGIINLNYQSDEYKFIKVNLEKVNKKQLNILGDLKYTKNLSKNLTNLNYVVKINKDNTIVDFNFKSLNITDLSSYYEAFIPINFNETIVDGKLELRFFMNKLNNMNFVLKSDMGKLSLYKNFSHNYNFKNIYEFKELDFRGQYNFINKSLKISLLNFNYKNNLTEWAYLDLKGNGNLLEKDSNFRFEINFSDLIPYSVLKNNFNKYEDMLNLKYSGKSLLEIKNNKLSLLELYLDNVEEFDLLFSNIVFKKNFNLGFNKLSFNVKGQFDALYKNLSIYDIVDVTGSNIVNGLVKSNIELIFFDSVDINSVEFYIKGSIQNPTIDNNNENLLFKEYRISAINFNINKTRDKTGLYIKNLDFILANNLDKKAFIFYSGHLESFKDGINLEGNFEFKDFLITNLYNSSNEDFLKLFSKKISGNGKINIKNSKFNKFYLTINDFGDDNLSIQNIFFKRNNDNNVYELNLDLSMSLYKLLQVGDVYNQELLNIISSDQDSNIINSNVNMILDTNFELITTIVSGKINNINVNKNLSILDQFKIDVIHDIKFKLVNMKNKLSIIGDAKVINTQINFNYLNQDEKNIFHLVFALTDQQLESFNINNKYINGESVLKINFYEKYDNWSFEADINFYNSKINIPFINYNKNIMEYSNLYLSGVFDNEFLVKDLFFNFKDMKNKVSGSVNFENYNEFIDIYIKNFIYDNNNFSSEIRYSFNRSANININSGTMNLYTFLHSTSANNNTNFDITAKLGNLILFDDFYLKNVLLDYKYENNTLSYFNIYGNYFGKEIFKLTCFKKEGSNLINKYVLSASDAGKFFESMNYKTEIKGGYFSSEGFFGNLDNNKNIMGTISIDNFRVMKAPIFAELLLAASLTGLIDVLNNDGIEFEQFDAQYFGHDEVYTITKSRAYGFSLGITGEGWIDKINKSIDIKGSLIPAYKINSFFNNIPIIGEIIAGKEDEGLFAINYKTKGDWEKLETEINPLSVLTPGLLRNVFDFLN